MDSDVLSKARFALGESGCVARFRTRCLRPICRRYELDVLGDRRRSGPAARLCASGSGEARCDHRHDDRGHATKPSRAPRVS